MPNKVELDRYSFLLTAYQNTDYIVMQDMGEHFVLRIGETCAAADDILRQASLLTAAFITPENPFSNPLSDVENYQRCSAFERILANSGSVYLRGVGRAQAEAEPKAEWADENSFFILGITEKKATSLAQSFGQNAFVMYELGAVARLVWCVATPEKHV